MDAYKQIGRPAIAPGARPYSAPARRAALIARGGSLPVPRRASVRPCPPARHSCSTSGLRWACGLPPDPDTLCRSSGADDWPRWQRDAAQLREQGAQLSWRLVQRRSRSASRSPSGPDVWGDVASSRERCRPTTVGDRRARPAGYSENAVTLDPVLRPRLPAPVDAMLGRARRKGARPEISARRARITPVDREKSRSRSRGTDSACALETRRSASSADLRGRGFHAECTSSRPSPAEPTLPRSCGARQRSTGTTAWPCGRKRARPPWPLHTPSRSLALAATRSLHCGAPQHGAY